MTDLRKAAGMALNVLERASDAGYSIECEEAIEALRQALAQTEQEPVAWQVMVENEPMKEFSIKDMAHDWAVTEKRNGSKYSYWIRPLYTAPPKREWVGLTDEEIKGILDCGRGGLVDIKKAEAKLKEKNND